MRRERVEDENVKGLKRQEVEKVKTGSRQLEMMIWKFSREEKRDVRVESFNVCRKNEMMEMCCAVKGFQLLCNECGTQPRVCT